MEVHERDEEHEEDEKQDEEQEEEEEEEEETSISTHQTFCLLESCIYTTPHTIPPLGRSQISYRSSCCIES